MISSSPGPVLPQTQIGSAPGKRPVAVASSSSPGTRAPTSAVSNFMVPVIRTRPGFAPSSTKRRGGGSSWGPTPGPRGKKIPPTGFITGNFLQNPGGKGPLTPTPGISAGRAAPRGVGEPPQQPDP